jgi:hypothetical protein
MMKIALFLAVFVLSTPVISYSETSESTPLAGQGGAKAGQETIRSGIAGQALKEKDRQQAKNAEQQKGHKNADKRSGENSRKKP